MAYRYFLILSLFLISAFATVERVTAQSAGYELLPAPDLWYNDVDGIRIGLRVKGQVPGTFDDGPHRLDAGFWVGTWFPDLPVSYYVSFLEPIPAWSDFGSEASVELVSSVRTGYLRQGIGFNKRWQRGFDERRYRELSLFQTFENRFDDEYVPFPSLWSDHEKLLTHLNFELQNDNRFGWYRLRLEGRVQYLENSSHGFSITAIQEIPLNDYWKISIRSFTGFNSDNARQEYLFTRSNLPAQYWIDKGLTRAKGTIPQPWMESGHIQVAGGANLRGYVNQDFSGASPALIQNISSINAEFDFWNPVEFLLNRSSYLSDFVSFRSYLFTDAGTAFGENGSFSENWISDTGAGFAFGINIPDNRGKTRGFVIRYDLPFWLSDPADGEESFQYRYLFSVGAVISL